MSELELLEAWETGCARYEIDVSMFPNPSYWHDLRDELEYARASITENTPDKDIADNVRCCLWLTEIGHLWEQR